MARHTNETEIAIALDLDGGGRRRRRRPGSRSSTTCSTQLGRHGGFDLDASTPRATSRSTPTTPSRTSASLLGEAFARGARRQGGRAPLRLEPRARSTRRSSTSPSTCRAGRSCVYEVDFPGEKILGDPPFDPQLVEEFWRAFAVAAGHHAARHARCAGRNTHHIIEATFKGVARSLRDAVRVEGDGRPVDQGDAADGTRRDRSSPCSTTASATSARPQKALEHVGRRRPAHRRPRADRATADAVVLPGVGAFGRCMEALRARGPRRAWRSTRSAAGGRSSGSASGMQMLYEASEESPGATGPRGAARHGPPAAGRREAPADAVERARARAARRRCSTGSRTPVWMYFVHSYAAADVESTWSPPATTAAR